MFPRALLAAAAAGLIGPWMAVSEQTACAATPKAMSQAALGTATDPDARPSAATETPAAAPASRPTTEPAAAASDAGSRWNDKPILNTDAAGAAAGRGTAGSAAGVADGLGGTLMSLAVVLGLIVAGVWVVRKLFPGMRGGPQKGPVQVMGRHFLSPKQQLYLVKIGTRVVVIGAAGANLNQVCQITDAEEIAQLAAQCEQANTGSISRSFRALFSSHRDKLAEALDEPDASDAAAPADEGAGSEEVGEMRQELNSTVGRLRQFLSRRRGEA
jgi:flagellar biogenesis protein FliO